MTDRNILKLYKGIKQDIKTSENYHTGLVGEAVIVASYKQMGIKELEAMQFIIGKILKKKKEFKRQNDSINHVSDSIGGNSDPKKPGCV